MTRALRAWWRTYRLILSSSFGADRAASVALLLALPALYVAPALGAVAAGWVVDAAVDDSPFLVARAAGLAGLTVLFMLAMSAVTLYALHALNMKVDVAVRLRIGRILTSLPGIGHQENPEYLDRVRIVRRQAGYVGAGLNATAQLVAVLCQVVVVLAVLVALAPPLILLPLFAVPSFMFAARARRIDMSAVERTAEADRLRHRFHHLVSDLPVAREARLFGLGDELRRRRAGFAAVVDSARGRALLRSTGLRSLGELIFMLGYLGAIVVVMRRVGVGEVSAGAMTTAVILAGQVQGFISGLVGQGQQLAWAHQAAGHLHWLERRGAGSPGVPAGRGEPGAAPVAMRSGLELENVSFGYPGTGRPVLRGVNLRLPAGAVVALVGDNGAGKSTLVKLLLRMYEPSAGRITVDGRDLAAIDPDQWRAAASGAFQDFCRPEFLAREAIALGDLARLDDPPAVLAAAHDAGAGEVVDQLPAGLETQLGAGWTAGVDLSGGQWQRLALARARLRGRPLLLVLDEPTAALDAETEAAMFDRFVEASDRVREHGGVTLLITHRFGSARRADWIVVLENGVVVEQGPHDALLDAGGLYARLFELQAATYR